MIARLWWKEWRIFGPAGLLLLLGAAGVQWIYLTSNGSQARDGSATPLALIWAVLYAYAAGAAAFAAERESKTLDFLDALPVSRPVLWLGKASFGLASTAALALLLVGLASLGTSHRSLPQYGLDQIASDFALYLLEGLAWGLFWSSVLRNPLAAGAMAVVSVGLVAFSSNAYFGLARATDWQHNSSRVVLALLALGGSLLGMTAKGPAVRVEVRRALWQAYDMPIASATPGRSLVWQAWREGWTTLALAALLVFLLPILGMIGPGPIDPGAEILLASIACLTVGIGVFGPENASGTRRFLLHHGVSPAAAWAWKMLISGSAIAAIAALLSPLGFVGGLFGPRLPNFDREFPLLMAVLLDAFGVGLICGMAGRRRITSGLVGVVALIALAPAQFAAAALEMIPPWSLLITPVILIVASGAWAADWLAEPAGYRPYGRLAVLLAVPLGLEAAGYVAYRAWGVADVGPIAASPADPGPVPTAEDAAEAYRKAADMIWTPSPLAPAPSGEDAGRIIEEGWDPKVPGAREWVERHAGAIEAARKAAAMPRISSGAPILLDSRASDDPLVIACRKLARLLSLEARYRQSRGDLAGAWGDILAQFRMAGQMTANRPNLTRMLQAAAIHHQAVGLAIDWASDPKQDLAEIRHALDDLKNLPPPQTLDRALPAEAEAVERLLALPNDDLTDLLNGGRHSYQATPGQRFGSAFFGAPPWERERARRVARKVFTAQGAALRQEPYRRGPAWVSQYGDTGLDLRGSPLARQLLPNVEGMTHPIDREAENRRALQLVLALVSWKLAHDGQYPETLEALIPTVLSSLPIDPYSGRPFGYAKSGGQPTRPPILDDAANEDSKRRPTRPGQWLLYSVGPDMKDDRAAQSYGFYRARSGDLIVPLP